MVLIKPIVLHYSAHAKPGKKIKTIKTLIEIEMGILRMEGQCDASLEGAAMILPRVGMVEVTIERDDVYGQCLTKMAAQYENGPRHW